MIIGDYPCCNGPFSVGTPKKTPVWYSEDCPHCGHHVWHRLSRVDPMSWTVEDFEAEFIIDREKKIITRRDGQPTETYVRS